MASRHDPVTDPEYWRDRMYSAFASGERHRLMFKGSKEQFDLAEIRQWKHLSVIGPQQSVIDVGCGYGRLLDALRTDRKWRGRYVGYDVSPDLVAIARKWWPGETFEIADFSLDPLPTPPFRADWVVCSWIKTMLVGNGHGLVWDRIETWARSVARDVLIID